MRFLLSSVLLLLPSCSKTPIRPAVIPAVQPKLAILDIQRAVTSTREGKTVSDDLIRQFYQDFAKFNGESQRIKWMRRQLLNSDFAGDRVEVAKEIDAREKSLSRNMKDAREHAEIEKKRVLKDLTAKLMTVAGDYAKENRFDVILDPNNILWRADSTDITDKVIELYDLKYR